MAANIETEQNSRQQLVLLSQSTPTDDENRILRRLDPAIKEYQDPDDFDQLIRQPKTNQAIILIVDDTLLEHVLRWLNDFETIDSVYLIQKRDSTDEKKTEHPKLRFQSQSLAEISTKISDNGFRSNISTVASSKLEICDIDSNIYLSKILFRLCTSLNDDRTNFVNMCFNLNKRLSLYEELHHVVSRFSNNYDPENPAYWLFEEAFTEVCHDFLANPTPGAFLILRPFLHDLWNQFKAQKCDRKLRFYMVRYLDSKSMDFWKKQKDGNIVAVRSFMVAKTSLEEVDTMLAAEQHPNSQKILFEIEADPNVMKSSMFILNSDQNEAIIMCGTFLRLVANRTDSDNVLRVSMIMCTDDAHELNSYYSGLMPLYDREEQTISIPEYLHACFQISSAINNSIWMQDVETIIQEFMNALDGEYVACTAFLDILGWIRMKQSRWEECIELNLKSVEMKSILPGSQRLLVENYLVLVDAYSARQKYDDGIACVNKLMNIFEKLDASDDHWKIEFSMKLGRLFYLKGENQQALMYLYDALKSAPASNSGGGTWASYSSLYGDLGKVHYALGDFQIAIGYYKQAMHIRRGQGIVGDKLLGEYYRYVGLAYGKAKCVEQSRRFLDQARSSFNKAGIIEKSDEVLQDINALDAMVTV